MFESEDLTSVTIARTLKKCFSRVGEYLFDVKRESLSSDISLKIKPFLSLSKEDSLYKSGRRSSENFRKFFLQENKIFNELLSGKREEFIKEFFTIAESSLEAAFDDIKKRLPNMDSIVMLGDSIVIKEIEDIDNLHRIGQHFKNLYSESDFFQLNKELQCIKEEIEFICRLKEVNDKYLIREWKTQREKYPQLYRLIEIIQVLPYSNSSVEREFSNLTLIKTFRRNRLSPNSIEACLIMKQEDTALTDSFYSKINTNSHRGILSKAGSMKSNTMHIETDVGLAMEEEKKEENPRLNPETTSKETGLFDFRAKKRPNPNPIPLQNSIIKPKPVNLVSGNNDEELSSKMMEELSIRGSDDDDESNITSTKRGSNTTNKKENKLLATPKKTKEVYQAPSKRIDSKEKEPNKQRAFSSGKQKKENKKTTLK